MKKVKLNVLLMLLVLISACDYEDGFDQYDDAEEGIEDYTGEPGSSGDDPLVLTTYKIIGNQISKVQDHPVADQYQKYQDAVDKHQKMWAYFTEIIPEASRANMVEFIVFYGNRDFLGYVEPIVENDLSKWRIGLAIDASGELEEVDLKADFAYTIIHEVGHVLTLNAQQVDAHRSDDACNNFYTGEGCAKANAYINSLFNLGWADIYNEFLRIKNDNQAFRFYDKYADRFVSEYASSNPGEDIAELFAVFVTQDDYPEGLHMADQKLRLLYSYPELVQLRENIRETPVLRAMLPQLGKATAKCRHQHVEAK